MTDNYILFNLIQDNISKLEDKINRCKSIYHKYHWEYEAYKNNNKLFEYREKFNLVDEAIDDMKYLNDAIKKLEKVV